MYICFVYGQFYLLYISDTNDIIEMLKMLTHFTSYVQG